MITKILHNIDDAISMRTVSRFVLQYRNAFILLFLIGVSMFSFYAAFSIRFDFAIPRQELLLFFEGLPLLLLARLMSYYYFKIHSGSWLYVSMRDLIDTFKAVLSGSVLFLLFMVFIYRIGEFGRSVFIIDGIINLLIIGGSRFFIRYYSEFRSSKAVKIHKYVLIVGAGKAGVMMLNEIRNNSRLGIQVVGFIDDNPYKKGINIQGVPVLGNAESIPRLVKEHTIDEVIIAIPSASYRDVVRITEIAESAQVKTQILPNLKKLFDNGSSSSPVREVQCDDLLGRRAIKFCRESDRKHMEEEIRGKAVLVTGAGGSIGSELSRQVAEYGPRTLILFDRYENSLYDLELDLRRELPPNVLVSVIGDILDTKKVDSLLRQYSVELIYHAAAYKHVPLMEKEPVEAVRNNVLGTMNLAKLAVKNRVGKFVLISTDKAVNPANIMGTTKRVAERVVQSLNGDGTRFIAVRFGNVIGSNGSVIPLFKKQIARGGPITVTDPKVTRYFMSIPEAVQLVMTAGAMGSGGEIFLLDMGEPVKIVDLAKELIRLSGLELGKDIDIQYTGLRPGEKLYEELFWKGEGIVPTKNKKITMLKQADATGDNGVLTEKIDLLNDYVALRDLDGIYRLLKDIVPESAIKRSVMAQPQPVQQTAAHNVEPAL